MHYSCEEQIILNKFKPWRKRIHEIIFGYETHAGKLFDVILMFAIILSVIVVMLESVNRINLYYGFELRSIEWVFTVLFTVEYFGRIISSPKPIKYIFSFMGIVDLLSIIPTYFSLFIEGAQLLLIIRFVRLVRVFRILKLSRYIRGARMLGEALKDSKHKIIVFFSSIIIIVVIMGTLMYIIEHGDSGFDSIPRSIYWAIVTITTVGYGDIAPTTVLGQTVAAFLMIVGYAIIAVPTGIVTSEMMRADGRKKNPICNECGKLSSINMPNYCYNCGSKM
ncbi:MAG: ion transporter [Bacteroidetes bacterium]|nr:ion transporter [Bacteroidota bacterium]